MNILDLLKPEQIIYVNIKFLKKEIVLFRENDLCESIGIVIKGQINIVSYLENGKEIIYNQLKANGIFGNNLIFSSKPYYKGNVVAITDSEIAIINKIDLIDILKSNEAFMIEYLKIQSDISKTMNDKIKLLSIDSAEDRFYYYMYENKNKISYSSVTELSKQIYMKRETLSRLLSKLQKQNKLIKNKNYIELK